MATKVQRFAIVRYSEITDKYYMDRPNLTRLQAEREIAKHAKRVYHSSHYMMRTAEDAEKLVNRF